MARSKTAGKRLAEEWRSTLRHAARDDVSTNAMVKNLAADVDAAIEYAAQMAVAEALILRAIFDQGEASIGVATTNAGETKGKNFKPAKKTKGAK